MSRTLAAAADWIHCRAMLLRSRTFLVGLVLAALSQAAAAQSVTALPSASDPILSLRQITVTLSHADDAAATEAKVRALKDAAAEITSCAQVAVTAARIGGSVIANDGVRLSTLPEPLRKIVAAQPVGTATPMFGEAGQYVRVLVLCERRTP